MQQVVTLFNAKSHFPGDVPRMDVKVFLSMRDGSFFTGSQSVLYIRDGTFFSGSHLKLNEIEFLIGGQEE